MMMTRPGKILACLAAVLAGFWVLQCSSVDKDRLPITTYSAEARTEFLAGLTLFNNVRFHEAQRHFQKATKSDPEFGLAFFFLAYTEPSAKGLFDNLQLAKTHSARASRGEQLLIEGALAAAEGNLARQRELFDEVAKMYPKDEGVLMLQAAAFFDQQMYDSSVLACERIIQLAPSYAAPYNILGYSYRALGNLDGAARAFQEYIRLIPDDPNPYDSYAELLTRQGNFEEAIRQYRLALDRDRSFGASRVGISANLIFLGRYEEARRELNVLYDSAANTAHKRAALIGLVVSYVDEGRLPEALVQLDALYELDASIPDPLSMSVDLRSAAFVLAWLGQFEEAERRLLRAVEVIENSDVFARVKRDVRTDHTMWQAALLLEQGRYDEARVQSDKYLAEVASTLNPNRLKYAHLVSGRIALAEGQFDRAISELEQADQFQAWTIFHLAKAYEGKGDRTKAGELYEQAATAYELNSLYYARIRRQAVAKADELRRALNP
jgi:tetratricopeptide (TPR) repeat protein